MGLEFRNNSYEENQNEVLSSSTEDRRWNAREDGAPCGSRVWERLWQAWEEGYLGSLSGGCWGVCRDMTRGGVTDGTERNYPQLGEDCPLEQ